MSTSTSLELPRTGMNALPFDTLFEIVSHVVQWSDLSKMSRTCRAFHAAGVRELLRRPIPLCCADDLTSFLAFIAADEGRRAQHVKYLVFGFDRKTVERVKGATTHNMARILKRCTAVESLFFHDGGFVLVDARVMRALVQLEHIKHLRMNRLADAEDLQVVFVCMRSHCESVHLDYYYEDPLDMIEEYAIPEPLDLLEVFAESLKDLIIDSDPWDTHTTGTRYLNVTTLMLKSSVLDTSTLVYAFPNLRRLLTKCSPYAVNPESRATAVDSFHQRPWKDLDYFEGTAMMLYELGVDCPIRRWKCTDAVQSQLSDAEWELLCTLVVSTRVTHLQLVVYPQGDPDDMLDTLTSMLLRTKVTHLEMFVDHNDCWEEFTSVVDKLIDCAKRMKLQYLGLQRCFHHNALHLYGEPKQPNCDVCGKWAEPLATRFICGVPTLKYFVWVANEGWSAVRDGSRSMPNALNAEETEAINRQEGMGTVQVLWDSSKFIGRGSLKHGAHAHGTCNGHTISDV